MANHVKGPRPWCNGNRSRTGRRGRPAGSGSKPLDPSDVTTNFTFRIPKRELQRWQAFSQEELHMKTGQMIRNAVRDYIEDTLHG